MPTWSVKRMLLCRLLGFFVMVLKAHSQALFMAMNPSTNYQIVAYASISCIVGSTAATCLFIYLFQEELAQQLGSHTRKGRIFCAYTALSLLPLGLLLTCLLVHKLHYDKYAYVSKLLPPCFSMLNTLINTYT